MIEIIEPIQFKTVSWKNGLGETIEMAINPGATLDNFDWRLSMAKVVEDGVFSNFSGYTRNLILIEGDGIDLTHDENKTDKLNHLLDYATFDGSSKTMSTLHSSAITDFNVITRTSNVHAKISCQQHAQQLPIEASELCFVYSLLKSAEISVKDQENKLPIPAGHLVKLSQTEQGSVHISGEHLIIVYLRIG
jgi:environmental stress-induced protein Ves